MAKYTANATGNLTDAIWEPTLVASPAISTSTSNVTSAGIFTGTFTAPNTTNKDTGTWINVATKPTNGGNFVVTLQEATVDTACAATINNADIKLGWNYVRFPTPYQYTSTAAGRYRYKITNPTGTSGALRLIAAASTVSFLNSYDAPTTIGTTDDIWIGGFNNSGLTAKTVTVTGTSSVIGSGTDKAVSNNAPQTVGAAVQIGNGGTLKWDTTASATLQTRGQVVIHEGGTYDKRAHATDHTIVATHIFDCETANGNYAINNIDGGRILTNGAPCTRYAKYVSGVGTAANPLIVDRACDWQVGEEIGTGSEARFIKTRNSSTSFVLSSTVGGAEAAFSNTHYATEVIALLSRNSVFKPQNTARGYYFVNNDSNAGNVDVTDTQFYYPSLRSGAGSISLMTATGRRIIADGVVLYAGVSNRQGLWLYGDDSVQTIDGLCVYTATSTNAGSGAMAIGQIGATGVIANKTFNNCIALGCSSQTLILTNAFNIELNNFMGVGNNTSNAAAGHTIRLIGSGSITFNNGSIDGSKQQAVMPDGSSGVVFNDMSLASFATNVIDVAPQSSTLDTVVFNNCTFGSATLISGHTSMLEGSRIGFHRYQDTDRRHRAYQPNVEIYSSGSGLTYTTADTTFDADSLAMRIAPLSATLYGKYNFYMPQRAGNIVLFSGKILKDASFNGDATVSIYLDGESAPSQTYTLSGSDSVWHPIVLSADYTSGIYDRNARIEVEVRGTAGAVYLDTFFNAAKATNPIGSLDLWQDGVPNPYLVSTVASASEIAGAVWSDNNDYAAGTKGKIQSDSNLTNVLAKDKLS